MMFENMSYNPKLLPVSVCINACVILEAWSRHRNNLFPPQLSIYMVITWSRHRNNLFPPPILNIHGDNLVAPQKQFISPPTLNIHTW